MCDKKSFREQGYKPRKDGLPYDPEQMELYNANPMNRKDKKRKTSTRAEFQEDYMR